MLNPRKDLMVTTARDRFYLNKIDGKLFGVCAGLADYLGVDAIWIRIALVVLTLLGWGSTIPLYLLVAFVASRRPTYLEDTYEYASAEDDRRAVRRAERLRWRRLRDTELRSDLGDMDRRINEMERHFRVRD